MVTQDAGFSRTSRPACLQNRPHTLCNHSLIYTFCLDIHIPVYPPSYPPHMKGTRVLVGVVFLALTCATWVAHGQENAFAAFQAEQQAKWEREHPTPTPKKVYNPNPKHEALDDGDAQVATVAPTPSVQATPPPHAEATSASGSSSGSGASPQASGDHHDDADGDDGDGDDRSDDDDHGDDDGDDDDGDGGDDDGDRGDDEDNEEGGADEPEPAHPSMGKKKAHATPGPDDDIIHDTRAKAASSQRAQEDAEMQAKLNMEDHGSAAPVAVEQYHKKKHLDSNTVAARQIQAERSRIRADEIRYAKALKAETMAYNKKHPRHHRKQGQAVPPASIVRIHG
eukprot:TRINITY_DN1896_c0_g1_i1.p1 TRINITY_DN1896_c0_g1~~TRINITY_DN1896_c0_g1_i1.p1  ORF type:complete len:339 (-),score=82.42 TRINITY_DN1896_c0_g1_i1:164-1180(-)